MNKTWIFDDYRDKVTARTFDFMMEASVAS